MLTPDKRTRDSVCLMVLCSDGSIDPLAHHACPTSAHASVCLPRHLSWRHGMRGAEAERACVRVRSRIGADTGRRTRDRACPTFLSHAWSERPVCPTRLSTASASESVCDPSVSLQSGTLIGLPRPHTAKALPLVVIGDGGGNGFRHSRAPGSRSPARQ